MAGGRPREHDREQIALDIVAWATKPDSLNLNKFCVTYHHPFPPTQLAIWGSQDTEFRKAVDLAKGHLAYRREEKLASSELPSKAYDLNATVYDALIREEKKEMMSFESSLKQQEAATVTQGQIDAAKAFNDQLSSLQSKAAATTNIKDNKS